MTTTKKKPSDAFTASFIRFPLYIVAYYLRPVDAMEAQAVRTIPEATVMEFSVITPP